MYFVDRKRWWNYCYGKEDVQKSYIHLNVTKWIIFYQKENSWYNTTVHIDNINITFKKNFMSMSDLFAIML